MPKLKIKTKSKEQTLDVDVGAALIEVAEVHATPLVFGCREADCGVCAIKVVANPEGFGPMHDGERDFLKALDAEPNERLGCQCRIVGDVTIFVDE